MAEAHSVPPLDLPRNAGAAQSVGGRCRFGVVGTALWLCLMGVGSSQPLLHARGASSEAECLIQQKKPLYVGFAPGLGVESFEESALESRGIVREVKHWACAEGRDTTSAVASLQLAFARGTALRLERVQFDDAQLGRAHVLLVDAAERSDCCHWRLDLTHGDETGWAVVQSNVASAQDIAEP